MQAERKQAAEQLPTELLEAYEREEYLYARIMEVVEEQHRVLSGEPDTEVVVDLCGLVQGLMKQISDLEARIETVKQSWMRHRRDPEGRLAAVLDRIQDYIDRIGTTQEQVQAMLLDHLVQQRDESTAARADMNAHRAAAAYGAL
jgi:hypothetical protein